MTKKIKIIVKGHGTIANAKCQSSVTNTCVSMYIPYISYIANYRKIQIAPKQLIYFEMNIKTKQKCVEQFCKLHTDLCNVNIALYYIIKKRLP